MDWLKTQMAKVSSDTSEQQERIRREQQEKQQAIQDLRAQQEELSRKLAELEGLPSHTETPQMPHSGPISGAKGSMMEQLKEILASKREEDPNRALLKALLTQQNKMPGDGGTNTLKPNILSNMVPKDNPNMAEWLASLNRQEEGEFDLSKFFLSKRRHAKSVIKDQVRYPG